MVSLTCNLMLQVKAAHPDEVGRGHAMSGAAVQVVMLFAVLSPCRGMTNQVPTCRMMTDQQRVGGQHLTGTTEWYDINIAVPMAGTPDPYFLTTMPGLDKDLAAVSCVQSCAQLVVCSV